MGKAQTAVVVFLLVVASLAYVGGVNATINYPTATMIRDVVAYEWAGNYTNWEIRIHNYLVANDTTGVSYLYLSVYDIDPTLGATENGTQIRYGVSGSAWSFIVYTISLGTATSVFSGNWGNLTDWENSIVTIKCDNNKIQLYTNGTKVDNSYPIELPSAYSNYMTIADNNYGWESGYIKIEHGRTAGSIVTEYMAVIIVLAVLGGVLGVLLKRR